METKRHITPENAREMQQKSAKKRRANAIKRKTAAEYARAALGATIKIGDEETTISDAIVRQLVKQAVQDHDLNIIKYLHQLIGEAPATKIDHTTNGKSITPARRTEGMTLEEIRAEGDRLKSLL